MNFHCFKPALAIFTLVWLAACATSEKRVAAGLKPIKTSVSITEGWSTSIGAVEFPMNVVQHGTQIALASSEGVVAVVDALTGKDVWRTKLTSKITAGVGFDGATTAVVNAQNEVVAVKDGTTRWSQKLTARGYTSPLVAGDRVFVLSADRVISAYDADTGRRLWVSNKSSNEQLVLQNTGVLISVGDTLVVGISGRLIGLNPNNGSTLWDVTAAFVRGGNDVERLIDVIGPAARYQESVCVRVFQLAQGCMDVQRRSLSWMSGGKGTTGLAGDANLVFATESDGKIIAFRRSDGVKIWVNEQLSYRDLSTPASNGRIVVVADGFGVIHWIDRMTGEIIGRTQKDKSAVLSQPLMYGNQAVLVNKSGSVTSYLVQ